MIEILLKKIRIVSGMIDENHIRIILKELDKTITNNIPGDVVELGCNVGSTSLFIQAFIEEFPAFLLKKFHVYDSFMGLPDKSAEDEARIEGDNYEKGGCPSTVEQFINHFNEFDLPYPKINIGWFKDIPHNRYPNQISFAFLDGDFYSSIMDSWKIVYPRLSKGAIVCIHDYDWEKLPGVKKACDDFLDDKPEKGSILFSNYIGIFTKL